MRFNQGSDLTNLFEDLFGVKKEEKMERKNYECAPATNIIETNEGFHLQMAVPGVKKEDIKIDIEKNILNISSEKSANENTDETVKYTRREFLYGTFCRSFTLPETINVEKITAEVKEGVLTVELPKNKEAKVSKTIKIS